MPQPTSPPLVPQTAMSRSDANLPLRMLASYLEDEPRKSFLTAKCAMRAELPDEIETAYNPQGLRVGWRLAHIMSQVKGPLVKHGFDIRWELDCKTDVVCCYLQHISGHFEVAEYPFAEDVFSDMPIPAHRYMSALTMAKRTTLEMVLGLSTGETDAILNQVTYGGEAGSAPQTAPATPTEPTTPEIDWDTVDKLKVHWFQHKAAPGAAQWSDDDKRKSFYNWVSTELELPIQGDDDWTPARLDAMADVIKNDLTSSDSARQKET